jgi:hypothetical protein
MSKQSDDDDITSVASGHTSPEAEAEVEEWMDDRDSIVEESINDHAVYDHALFYANFNAKRNNRNGTSPSHCRVMICIGIVLGLIVSGILIKVVVSRAAQPSNVLEGSSSLPSVTSQAPSFSPPDYSGNDGSNPMSRTVVFDHRHNVGYDGVRLFKNNTNGLDTYNWDAYAKTTEPITELKFAAGDTESTKFVVLTFHPFAGYEYGTLQEEAIPTPGEAAVIIGMYRRGEVWLPPNHNLQTYTTEDLFTLKVEGSDIILYLNDVALSKYDNPFGADHPLYAQVWLKEPHASLLAIATR